MLQDWSLDCWFAPFALWEGLRLYQSQLGQSYDINGKQRPGDRAGWTPNVRSSLWLSWQTYARLAPRSLQLNTYESYETEKIMSHLRIVRKIHMKHMWDLLWSHAFLSSGLRSCRARRSTEETCLRRRSWHWIGAKLGTPDEVQLCKWDKGWQGSPYFQDMPKLLFKIHLILYVAIEIHLKSFR